MTKFYEYKGKIYSEKDISMICDRYGGDLFDLFWELEKDGDACEETLYYQPYNPENVYSSPEELIEEEFSDLELEEENEKLINEDGEKCEQ